MQLSSSVSLRLKQLLESRTRPHYLKLISSLVILVQLALLIVTFLTQQHNQTRFGPLLGADFASFYTAGTIFNLESPAAVYIATVQDTTYHQLFPTVPADARLPYANAPFLTLLFAQLAQLPYPLAYLSWLLLTLTLYVGSFLLLWQTLDALPRHRKSTILLLALSFMPFLVEGWIGGQTSILAFGAIALAIYLERQQRPLRSGAVLSLCLYKPTLLVLIVPMLLLTRRIRTIVGLASGVVVLSALSWLIVGSTGLMNYLNMLLFFKNAAVNSESGLKIWKYIDGNSFFRLLLNDYPTVQTVLAATLFGTGLLCLAWRWWQRPSGNPDTDAALWSLTITGTLVFNLYVGIYEATLLVLSLLLFTHVCYRRAVQSERALSDSYKVLLILLYLTPWVSQWVAQTARLQLFTMVLLALGIYQWWQSGKTIPLVSTTAPQLRYQTLSVTALPTVDSV